jgi:hypothetical protein
VEIRELVLRWRGTLIASFLARIKSLSPNLISPNEPVRESLENSSREKWFALIALVAVSAFAMIFLYPK